MRAARQPGGGDVTIVPLQHPVLHAAQWIADLRGVRPEAWRVRPRAVCAALCAGRIATSLGSDSDEDAHVDWAADLLIDSSDRALRDLLGAPPAQTLHAAILCRRRGAAIPLLDRVLDSALELFASDAAVGSTEAHLVAHAAGLADAPRLPPWNAAIRLPLDDSEVAGLAAGLSAATGFGTSHGPGGDVALADLVGGLAGHYLRNYDLALGSALTRTLAHLGGADSIAGRRCLEFLRLQQRSDGAFGYFGPEDLELGDRLRDVEPVLDLHLPVTLSCMIAVAEAHDPAWRFVEQVDD
jgi:hypothetical protein